MTDTRTLWDSLQAVDAEAVKAAVKAAGDTIHSFLARHVRAFLCLAFRQPQAQGAFSCALKAGGVATACAVI